MQADRELLLTADRETVVEADDPRGSFVLVGAGGTVDANDARRYHLSEGKSGKLTYPGGPNAQKAEKAEPETETKPPKATAETKPASRADVETKPKP